MREQALRAWPRRRGLPKNHGERSAIVDNLLDRQFKADAPNRKWVAYFTYIWTAEGWLYVAVVLDLYSRRIVGWSMQSSMTSQLVADALMMAVWRRGRPQELLHHSDQGSQGGFNPSLQHTNHRIGSRSVANEAATQNLLFGYSGDEGRHVSHETIYRSLFIQARGALKKELLEHLRCTRGMRRSRHYTQKTAIHGQIADAVTIRERPACVEDRAVPGHWEGDLVSGSGNSQIATLVERQTRYVMLVKLDGKDTQMVVKALIKNARKLPQELYQSLTLDRGTEMHAHKQFTLATDIQVYFCDPQSPWQRGSNENTNGLLRQYMPKGMNLSGLSQHQLNAIARQLNERPRKTFGFRTPAEMFSECVVLTG